jgi:hypothetical protein
MNDWKQKYAKKIISAETALKQVKDGDRVVVGHACGEPPTLVEALVARAPELKGVEVVHMVAMGPAKYAQPGMEGSFRPQLALCRSHDPQGHLRGARVAHAMLLLRDPPALLVADPARRRDADAGHAAR